LEYNNYKLDPNIMIICGTDSNDNGEISIDRFKSNYINDTDDFTRSDELKIYNHIKTWKFYLKIIKM